MHTAILLLYFLGDRLLVCTFSIHPSSCIAILSMMYIVSQIVMMMTAMAIW